MVGLLYLPRLFVYHNDKRKSTDIDATFLLMEYRLLKYIMNPALIVTYLRGIILIYENNYLIAENYFLLKLALIFFFLCFTYIYLFFTKILKKAIDIKKLSFTE